MDSGANAPGAGVRPKPAKRIRVARSTKQPAKKLPNGLGASKKLNTNEFREAARLNEEQVFMLDEMAAGRAPRNALAVLSAMKLKAEYAYEKPSQKHELAGEGGGPITIEIKKFGGEG